MIWRVLIITIIGLAIFWGLRRIWRDWTFHFNAEEKEALRLRRERDLRERAQPGVIDLKRDKDGTYRPGDDNS